jgi:glycosyltransferase involved in cell wall biosynthesis
MNLLIVMPSGQLRGGAEEALLQYISCCVQAGQHPLVVVLEEGPIISALRERQARVVLIDAGQIRQPHVWLRTIDKLKVLIRSEKIDFVLSWMTKAHLYASPAAKLSTRPAAYFQHGLPDNGFIDRCCRVFPAVGAVGCSSFVAQEQQQYVKHPVLPVPMGADIARFTPVRSIPIAEMKVQLGFDPTRPLVGMVGRLQRWKGMHVFAEAFTKIRHTIPEIQGVIVGGQHLWEAEYESYLQQRIHELGVTDALKMVGAQRNIPEWMQAMDVIVHASEREPFGIVIVEALSLSKPVIATIPGGPAEIIEPDVSGQLVHWNDSDELARAIEKFLLDKDFAQRCGQNAGVRAQKFSMETFSKNLDKALSELNTKFRSQ